MGKGGDVALYVDGTEVGTGRVDATVPMLFSGDETTDVGNDSATPVSDDYGSRTSEFTGRIHWVQLDAGTDDADHFISPEERLRVAMARQQQGSPDLGASAGRRGDPVRRLPVSV